MSNNKFVSFFATGKGRVTSGILTAAAVTSGILAKYLPNSLLLDQTREFLQLYKSDYYITLVF